MHHEFLIYIWICNELPKQNLDVMMPVSAQTRIHCSGPEKFHKTPKAPKGPKEPQMCIPAKGELDFLTREDV